MDGKRQRDSRLRSDAISLAMAAVLILLLSLTAAARFFDRCERVRGETLRLHIVANSDTEEDQRHKLLVRDALLEEYSELLGRAESAEAAERLRTSFSRTSAAPRKRRFGKRMTNTRWR